MASSRFENRYFRMLASLKRGMERLTVIYSRILAHRGRKEVIRSKGEKVVNRQLKREIKAYAKERFGSKAYWPYLAFYTELRGEFMKGWLPYDYYRYKILPGINPQHACEISENKTYDHRIFGDFAIRPLFVLISGAFYDADFMVLDAAALVKLLAEYNDKIVVKEERGTHGLQVKVMHASEFNPDSLRKDLNYVVQPYVKQHKSLSNLYPHSVNTYRVTTFLRPDGSITVKAVILRFGINGSEIDNLSSGGQFIYFDEAGNPSKFAYNLIGLVQSDRHINTGFRFSDLEVPMFQEIKDRCVSAHGLYPYVRIIGWDICVDEKGDPKLLEWNADNPGFHPDDAIFGPLWADENSFFPNSSLS